MRRTHLYIIVASGFTLMIIYCLVFWPLSTVLKSYDTYAADLNISEIKDLTSTGYRRGIFIFFGTRPEIIKLAPLILELRQSNVFVVTTVFTGQHEDMIDNYLRLFNISVDITSPNTLEKKQTNNMLFGQIMLQADLLHTKEHDLWIIQGDTSSSLAIATVAFHKQIRIVHVEAGIRTFNMHSPYPEEFNRKTISSIATYNFAPTSSNAENLINEGIDRSRIFITGNTVIDAAKYLEEKQLIKMPVRLKEKTFETLVLVTIRRRENFKVVDSLFKAISFAKCRTCTFIVPVHANSIAGSSAKKICSTDRRFLCVSPLPFEELHWVLRNANIILTDSGGIQEEVTWYNTPTLIIKNSDEQKDRINSGIAQTVVEKELPIQIDKLLTNETKRKLVEKRVPVGDGNRAKQIVNILMTTNLNLNGNVHRPSLSNISLKTNAYRKLVPPEQNSETVENKITNDFRSHTNPSLAVILQVYKRKSLSKQLESVASQSLKPKTIVIVQNGYHVDVSTIIKDYRQRYKEIEFQHIASSKNLRFHGRFHIAFLQQEDYVSIWDDDVYAKRKWLEYSVEYSKKHNFCLVGANCRIFQKIDLKANRVIQVSHDGKCDFVGHIWTLPRQYLFFYLAEEQLTYYTGEDVQLSFALQKQGIMSFKPPMGGDNFAGDLNTFYNDVHSSWMTNQAPRTLLFCSLLLQNFKFIKCQNCDDKVVLKSCIELNRNTTKLLEEKMLNIDGTENTHAWS